MTEIAQRVDLRYLEELDIAAARAVRDANAGHIDWITAENAAFSVLERAESSVHRFNFDDINGISEQPLTLSGLILWSSSIHKLETYEQGRDIGTLEDAVYTGLKASAAFLYAGNIACASAIERNLNPHIQSGNPLDIFLSVIRTIRNLGRQQQGNDNTGLQEAIESYYRECMELRSRDLESRRPSAPNIADYISSRVGARSPFHLPVALGSLSYSFQTSIEWLSRQMAVHELDLYFAKPSNWDAYRKALVLSGPHFVFPSQRAAFRKLAALPSTTNIIVSFPTSAGKTFVGEVLALEPLLQGATGLAVMLVPLRALVNQYRSDRAFQDRLVGSGIRFVPAMGGYLDDVQTIDPSQPTLMIATPEAFDYAFRAYSAVEPALISAVIDEFQLIEQPERGSSLECLASTLLDVKREQRLRRISLLSAVVDETSTLQNWLDVPDEAVLTTSWVPTRKRIEIQESEGHGLLYHNPFSSRQQVQRYVRLSDWNFTSGWGSEISDASLRINRSRVETDVRAAITDLSLFAARRLGGGVLVVCRSRRSSRLLARALSGVQVEQDISELAPQVRSSLMRLMDLLTHKYPYYQSLLTAIKRRVCYHNAGLPSEVKQELETLMSLGYFTVVASTTTLAEGLNMPFRTVVMEAWDRFGTLLVRNIAGRAGRAGFFVEGDTIFADNVISSARIPARNYVEDRLLNTPVQLDSSFSGFTVSDPAASVLGQQPQVDEISGNQLRSYGRIQSYFADFIRFAGSVIEAWDFVKRLYVAKLAPETARGIAGTLDLLIERHVGRSPNALLVRNSPIQLTELGELSVKSGLSLDTSTHILDLLESGNAISARPRRNSTLVRYGLYWNPLLDAAFRRLRRVYEIDAVWQSESNNRDIPVNEQNITTILWAWCSGWSMPSILWLTRYREKANVGNWRWPLVDDDRSARIEGEIIELEGFCNQWFGYRWHWVLNALYKFAESLGHLTAIEYQQLALYVKYGVNGELALDIVSNHSEFPGSRVEAQVLQHWSRDKRISASTVQQLRSQSVWPTESELQQIVLDDVPVRTLSRVSPEMSIRIRQWLLDENLVS